VTASSSRVPWQAASLAAARLYLITGARPDLADFLAAACRGGVDLVQIREKELPDGRLLDLLHEARALTRELGVPLVVNDRPDLALLAQAEAVHVGQDDLPVAEARRFGLPVGVSTHRPDEIDGAEADYLGVGPVFATPTKAGRAPVGLELVRYAAARATKPWFAIGGVDRTNVEDVVAAGATKVAVVRAIGDAEDPEAAARELRAALA
jgi:thiamine-phosphate pyrophosphorylase